MQSVNKLSGLSLKGDLWPMLVQFENAEFYVFSNMT